VKLQAFETVDQAAGSAVAMLGEGERLSKLWRYVFVQMLDDYTSVLRHAGVSTAARMWIDAPRRTGDTRVDAAFAAMAEYLARRDGGDVRRGPGCLNARRGLGGSSPTCEDSTRVRWSSRRRRSGAVVFSSPAGHWTAYEHPAIQSGKRRQP
jgi:hypothetical protein